MKKDIAMKLVLDKYNEVMNKKNENVIVIYSILKVDLIISLGLFL